MYNVLELTVIEEIVSLPEFVDTLGLPTEGQLTLVDVQLAEEEKDDWSFPDTRKSARTSALLLPPSRFQEQVTRTLTVAVILAVTVAPAARRVEIAEGTVIEDQPLTKSVQPHSLAPCEAEALGVFETELLPHWAVAVRLP